MLTPAGSTYPYGNDPNDSVLRIAPTYIDIDELDVAMIFLYYQLKLLTLKSKTI